MSKDLKSIRNILSGQGSQLARLLEQAHQLEALNRAVISLLPANLKDHCRVATIRNQLLIVLVDSSAWATRARFAQNEILAKIRRIPEYQALTQIEFRVSPELASLDGHNL